MSSRLLPSRLIPSTRPSPARSIHRVRPLLFLTLLALSIGALASSSSAAESITCICENPIGCASETEGGDGKYAAFGKKYSSVLPHRRGWIAYRNNNRPRILPREAGWSCKGGAVPHPKPAQPSNPNNGNYQGAQNLTPSGNAEQTCANAVQGRVAWNRAGDRNWQPGNVKNLCQGTNDPHARISCFEREIQQHDDWQRAIQNCQGAGTTAAPSYSPPPPPPPQYGALRNGATYNLVAVHSNKCIDVSQVSTATGQAIHQWDCLGGSQTNQHFTASDMGGGFFQLRARHSNKCMDVSGVSQDNGAILHQWDCLGVNQRNQLFQAVDMGQGQYQLRLAHSGKCVDVRGPSYDNGAAIQQWACVGPQQTNQLFRLQEIR